MSSNQSQKRINHLADELQNYVWSKVGDNAPSSNEYAQIIENYLKKHGQQIVAEQKSESTKIPALLKKKPDAQESKRMRELAGIPHKGNFV